MFVKLSYLHKQESYAATKIYCASDDITRLWRHYPIWRYRLLLYSQVGTVPPVGRCWSRLSASNLGNGITEWESYGTTLVPSASVFPGTPSRSALIRIQSSSLKFRKPAFQIREVLIRIRIHGSVPLDYRSGSISCSFLKWLQRCQQK